MPLMQDRVVLVSGGTQGLGAGVARAAARRAPGLVTGRGQRRASGGRQLRDGGADGLFVQTDVTDPARPGPRSTATIERYGRIDGLVNAAGLTTRGTLLDTTPELFDAAHRGQPARRRSS